MFKKSLAVVAVLGAFAGASFAANVQIYGDVDPGFQYSYMKAKTLDKKDSFKMIDGANSAGKIGIKGEEKISDNLAVGFKLENGFDIKSGKFDNNESRLFNREAVMYVKSAAGTFAFGREGALASGFGMFGKFGGAVSAVSNGYGDAPGLKFVMGDSFNRYNNSITYESPNFAGVNLLAQYANAEQNNDGYFDKDQNSRYGALGATFKNDVAYGALIVSQEQRALANGHEKKSTKVSLGGNYLVAEDVKLFAATQYFNKSKLAKDLIYNQMNSVDADIYNGFGLNVGATYTFGQSALKGNFGYMHAKEALEKDIKVNRFTVMGAYDYKLSARTTAYAYGGAYFDRYKNVLNNAEKVKDGRALYAGFGLAHHF